MVTLTQWIVSKTFRANVHASAVFHL